MSRFQYIAGPRSIRDFVAAQDGATSIEYGLIASLIAAVVVTGVTALSGGLSGLYAIIQGVVT